MNYTLWHLTACFVQTLLNLLQVGPPTHLKGILADWLIDFYLSVARPGRPRLPRKNRDLRRRRERPRWSNRILTAPHLQPTFEHAASRLAPACHDATRLALLLPQFHPQECVKSTARRFGLSAGRGDRCCICFYICICCELWPLFRNTCFRTSLAFFFLHFTKQTCHFKVDINSKFYIFE